MAATKLPRDKFAFLFSGLTDARYIADLEKVYETLTEYYNYPASNIWIIQGTTFTGTFPAHPVTNQISIANETQLRNTFNIFAQYVQNNDVNLDTAAGERNSVLVYFTGAGISVSSESKLVITPNGGAGSYTDYVNYTFIQNMLITPFQVPVSFDTYLANSYVNVVMEQDCAAGFLTALQGATQLSLRSFIASCGDTQNSDGDSTGGYFTDAFIKALRMTEALPATLPPPFSGKFADELDATNDPFIVSLEEAKDFAAAINNATNYIYDDCTTPDFKYLGLPDFLIRDGNPSWWESDDIYLTHSGRAGSDDYYDTDTVSSPGPTYNNCIHINIRNIGTHPVRKFSLAYELFKSGVGATNDKITVNDRTPSCGVLQPILEAAIGTAGDKKDEYDNGSTLKFTEGTTHICIRSKAKLLDTSIDFAWTVTGDSYKHEAQRNIDLYVAPPSPPPPDPDQPEPEADPADNFKGKNEHIYTVKNPFKEKRTFVIAFPPEFIKYQNHIQIKWFQKPEGPRSEMKWMKPLVKGGMHIHFELRPEESKHLIFSLATNPNFNIKETLKIPFEILVEGPFKKDIVLRPPQFPIKGRELYSIAGITVMVKKGSGTLIGRVINKDNKPVPEATVFLRNFNGRNVATIISNKEGQFILREINQDTYFIRAEKDKWMSKESVVFIAEGKNTGEVLKLTDQTPAEGQKIKVVLEKIRILNDHDRRDRGEIKFTAIVTPDGDKRKQQLTALPAKGYYRVSDKPGENDIAINTTIFEGVVKNNHLSIRIFGKELDFGHHPDEQLKRYDRIFTGNPETWFGEYVPGDEFLDMEDVGDWALWYKIVK